MGGMQQTMLYKEILFCITIKLEGKIWRYIRQQNNSPFFDKWLKQASVCTYEKHFVTFPKKTMANKEAKRYQ